MDEVDNLRGQSSITSSQGERVRYGNSGVNGKVEWWEFSDANYVRISRLVPSSTVKDCERTIHSSDELACGCFCCQHDNINEVKRHCQGNALCILLSQLAEYTVLNALHHDLVTNLITKLSVDRYNAQHTLLSVSNGRCLCPEVVKACTVRKS
jgi:hypothetical protein